jgi:hypothetical protein
VTRLLSQLQSQDFSVFQRDLNEQEVLPSCETEEKEDEVNKSMDIIQTINSQSFIDQHDEVTKHLWSQQQKNKSKHNSAKVNKVGKSN